MSGELGETVQSPEYEVDQYFPTSRTYTDAERRELRREYGYVHTYFMTHPERHRSLQRWLNQARVGTTYDIYLTQSVRYAIAAGVGGALCGAALGLVLLLTGVLSAVASPVQVAPGPVGTLVGQLAVYRELAVVVSLTAGLGLTTGVGVYGYRYQIPKFKVSSRERQIEFLFPHALIFMFAMSHGGLSLAEIVDEVAAADDAYGSVADEFDMIKRDLELFGSDMLTAIRNARNLTPSDGLEQFFDDLVTVLESGGDVTSFLDQQGKRYLEDAQESQESFLETIALLSEVFIVLFVATPLFLVVILLVISVLGGDQLPALFALIYAVLPLGMAGFLVLLSTLGEPYNYPETKLSLGPERRDLTPPESITDDPVYEGYRRGRLVQKVLEVARDPLRSVHDQPLLTLVMTVPAVLVFFAVLAVGGGLPSSYDAFVSEPIASTMNTFVIPLIIVTAPLSFFHELKHARENEISKQFPTTLNILSSANQMGLGLTEGIEIVARSTGGYYADELRKLRNDVKWSDDLPGALTSLANRLDVPQVSLTVKIIAQGVRSSGNVSRILSIAAEDTRNRYKIITKRKQEMSMYIAVVFIGYLVYLLVIVMLDAYYLTPLAEIGAEQAARGASGDSPVGLADLPTETYRMLFFHSALVQGIGSGLLTGELADGSVRSGLKFALLLVFISILAFTLI